MTAALKREGIRLDPTMEWKCVSCGGMTEITSGKMSWRKCKVCGEDYYRNHCWNCSATVDSRDTRNPRCTNCGWFKCTCSACHISGCTTNPYKNDTIPLDILALDEMMQQIAMEAAMNADLHQQMVEQMVMEAQMDADLHQQMVEQMEMEAQMDADLHQQMIEQMEMESQMDADLHQQMIEQMEMEAKMDAHLHFDDADY